MKQSFFSRFNLMTLLRRRKGAVMSVAVFAVPVLIGCMGLAVDVGNLQLRQLRASKSLDASVIAGILAATTGDSATNAIAEDLAEKVGDFNLKRNGFDSGRVTVDVRTVRDGTQVSAEAANLQANVYFLDFISSLIGRTIDLKVKRAAAVRTPALVALVLDTSESMNDPYAGRTKIEVLKEAAINFVSIFDLSKDRLAIIGFGNQGKVYYAMPQAGESQDKGAIIAAIRSISPYGATNIAEGIALGRTQIENVLQYSFLDQKVIKAIVVVSDGAPTVYRGNFKNIQTVHPANQTSRAAGLWSPWHMTAWDWYDVADTNRDGKIDGFDAVIWVANYHENNIKQVTGGSADGDFDHDGDVDMADIVLWLDHQRKYDEGLTRPNPTVKNAQYPEINTPADQYFDIVLNNNDDPLKRAANHNPPVTTTWPEFHAADGSGFPEVVSAWRPLPLNPGNIQMPGSESGYNYLVWKNWALWANNDPNQTTEMYPACAGNAFDFPLWTTDGQNFFGKSPLRDCLTDLATYDSKGNLHDDFIPQSWAYANVADNDGWWNPLRYGNFQANTTTQRMPSMLYMPYYAAIREGELAKKKAPDGPGIQIYTVGIGITDWRSGYSEWVGCFKANISGSGSGLVSPTSGTVDGNDGLRCNDLWKDVLPVSGGGGTNIDVGVGGTQK